MGHNLKISVSNKPKSSSVLSCHNISIRERILRFLFGEKQNITILVPGDNVEEVAICTVKEGGVT